MRKRIIAESGGSKTSWCFENQQDNYTFVEGPSLHPRYWDELGNRIPAAIKELDFSSYDLFFYGAGCFRAEKRKELQVLLSGIGFLNAEVKGDVDAAVAVTLGHHTGWVAILGSGSVLCRVEKGTITELLGGNGEVDDFGSGFHFGRLIQQKLANGDLFLPEGLEKERIKRAQTKEAFLDLSKQISKDISAQIHRENLEMWLNEFVLNSVPPGAEIHFVGSYAYFHKEIIGQVLRQSGYHLGKCIAKPIEQLCPKK